MLNTPPELSPDLEWMLQSGQARKEMLAEALVDKYYIPILHLGRTILGDSKRAKQAALETFSTALLEAHRYDEKSGVRTWILGLALAACQTCQGKPAKTRTEPNDTLESGFPDSQNVQSRLQHLDANYADLEAVIGGWSLSFWEGDKPNQAEMSVLVKEIVRRADSREARQRRLTYLKELVAVACAIVLMGVMIWGSNRLTAEVTPVPPSRPTTAPIAAAEKQDVQIAANPIPNIVPALPEPLDLSSSPKEVENRILEAGQLWQTLWGDFDLVLYGPAGYVGPPHAIRAQVWLSQPDQVAILAGPVDSDPDSHFRGNDRGFFQATMDNLLQWYDRSYEQHLALGTDIENPTIRFSNLKNGTANLQVLGLELTAEREALVVDLVNSHAETQARLWVDTQRGVILRERLFSKIDRDSVVLDAFATQISYDANFSAGTTTFGGVSESKKFAQTPAGIPGGETTQPEDQIFAPSEWAPPANRRPVRSYSPPPPGFKAADNPLTFQFWHYFTSWEPKINGKSTLADLFAGDYYLGSLEVSDPFSLLCDRSPDGARLALAEGSKSPAREQSLLTWIDLSNAKNPDTLQLDLDLSNFAFAPEGRRLAIFGYGKHLGSLYVLDTDSGKLAKLLDLAHLRSLMWSPDGEYLAVTGNWRTPDYGEEMMVVQASSGEVTYLRQLGIQGQVIGSNPSAIDWEKSSPERMGNLAACAEPPEQQMVLNAEPDPSTYQADSPVSR